ncbi:MAG TPA: hypothetical protein VJ204_18300 [Solirubrobacterales bacterium]|nr:hypothetical protein [Solirubrobacterales bacterium]
MSDPAQETNGTRGGHPRWVAVLLVVGTIFTLLATFSIWANRQALNTDNWVSTSSRILDNKQVDERLSNYLAEQLAANEPVKTKLEEELPPRLQPLAGAVATGLRSLAPQIAERALQSPKVQALWATANREAHERLLEVLDGGGSAVSTENGEVTLNLNHLVEEVSNEVGIGAGAAEHLPPDVGRLVILKSDQLSAAQKGAHLVRELPIVLTLIALLCFAGAVYLSPRRRRALRTVGLCFVFVGVLVLLLRTIGGNVLVNSVVANPEAKPAVHEVWGIATSLLKSIATSTIVFGLLVFIAAWLAGPTGIATALRREAAPYVRAHWAVAYGAAAVIFLILVAWAPVQAFHKLLGILLLAVLLAIGTEILRRQILSESPDAAPSDLGGRMKDRASGLFSGWGGSAPDPATQRVEDLERLAALHRGGDLSDGEYATAKAELLGGTPTAPGPAPGGAPEPA